MPLISSYPNYEWGTFGDQALGHDVNGAAINFYLPAGFPPGRLSNSSGVYFPTSSVNGATSLYYVCSLGVFFPFYQPSSGMFWWRRIGPLSCALSDTTKNPSAIGVSKMNNWYVWDDAGTARLSHGPDWDSDTTPGTANALTNQGMWVNNVAITNGPAQYAGTYVGTTRSNASSQIDWTYGSAADGGGAAFFGIWNAYNRQQVNTMVINTVDSYTRTTEDTWLLANNSSSMRVTFAWGPTFFEGISASYHALVTPANQQASCGIGFNSTSAFSGIAGWTPLPPAATTLNVSAHLDKLPDQGLNYLQALEYQTTVDACTWYGDLGGGGYIQSLGLLARLRL